MRRHCKMNGILGVMLTAIAALAAIMPTARADDWPLVRGDSFGTAVANGSLPEAPEILWKYSAGKDAGFDATAVIANRVIYVGDNAGTFHAIRLSDGSSVWKQEFPDSGFGAGAAIKDGRLYVGDMNGAIYCMATADGKKIWQQELDGEVYAGPSLNGDDVLFTCEAGTLSCRNKHDGKERWQFHIEAPLRCTPTIAGGRALLAGCDSVLHLIDVTDGKEVGTVDIDGPTGSTPAMRDGRTFFGTESGTLFAINVPAEKEAKATVAWTYRDPQRNHPIRAAAALDKQVVIYGSQGKAIYGLDPATGDEKWKLPTKSRVESSPVIAGNQVVAATTAGKIYLLDKATGEVKWEYDAGGSFVASPAVVDGQFILGNSDGTLYCFGAKQGGAKKLTTEDTESTEKKAK
jgi:outer membrane protein assembly factor BamB